MITNFRFVNERGKMVKLKPKKRYPVLGITDVVTGREGVDPMGLVHDLVEFTVVVQTKATT